jgi:hypothetical protein
MKQVLIFLFCLLTSFTLYSQGRMKLNTLETSDSIKVKGIWYKNFPTSVATIDQARTLNANIGTLIQVTDTIQSGIFNVYPKGNYTLDSGMVFPMTDTNYVLVRDVSQSQGVFAKWFGVVANDSTNQAIKLQRAINYVAKTSGILILPEGTVNLTSGLDFTGMRVVANGTPFGMRVIGSGMGSTLKFNVTDTTGGNNAALNFYKRSTELQVYMENVQCWDVNGNLIGLKIGRLNRYSKFQNVRWFGFDRGIVIAGAAYGTTFLDCYIRQSRREAIFSDTALLPLDANGSISTEFRFENCYIDNNGTSCLEGGTYQPTVYLWNAEEYHFLNTVFEGNWGGGQHLDGQCENINYNGCRFEETLVRFDSGAIHRIERLVTNVKFEDCELAYRSKGVDAAKHYNLIQYLAEQTANRLLLLNNDQILDASNRSSADSVRVTDAILSPFNVVKVVNCTLGNFPSAFFRVLLPNRFLVTQLASTVTNTYVPFGNLINSVNSWQNSHMIDNGTDMHVKDGATFFAEREVFVGGDTTGGATNHSGSIRFFNGRGERKWYMGSLHVTDNQDFILQDIIHNRVLFSLDSLGNLWNVLTNVSNTGNLTVKSSGTAIQRLLIDHDTTNIVETIGTLTTTGSSPSISFRPGNVTEKLKISTTGVSINGLGGTNHILKISALNGNITSGVLTGAELQLNDVTTNNVSTTAHGFAPKLPNDATKYLDGTGNYSVPILSGGVINGDITDIGKLTVKSGGTTAIRTIIDHDTTNNQEVIGTTFGSGSAPSISFRPGNITERLNVSSTGITVSGTSGVTSTQYRLSALNTAPSSSTATGTTGEIRIAADFIYVCIATNTWVRAALTTW